MCIDKIGNQLPDRTLKYEIATYLVKLVIEKSVVKGCKSCHTLWGDKIME